MLCPLITLTILRLILSVTTAIDVSHPVGLVATKNQTLAGIGNSITCIKNTGGTCLFGQCLVRRGPTTCTLGQCICSEFTCSTVSGECVHATNRLIQRKIGFRNARWPHYYMYVDPFTNGLGASTAKNSSDMFNLYEAPGYTIKRGANDPPVYLLSSESRPNRAATIWRYPSCDLNLAGQLTCGWQFSGTTYNVETRLTTVSSVGLAFSKAPAYLDEPDDVQSVMIESVQFPGLYLGIGQLDYGVQAFLNDPGAGAYWIPDKHLSIDLPPYKGPKCKTDCGGYASGDGEHVLWAFMALLVSVLVCLGGVFIVVWRYINPKDAEIVTAGKNCNSKIEKFFGKRTKAQAFASNVDCLSIVDKLPREDSQARSEDELHIDLLRLEGIQSVEHRYFDSINIGRRLKPCVKVLCNRTIIAETMAVEIGTDASSDESQGRGASRTEAFCGSETLKIPVFEETSKVPLHVGVFDKRRVQSLFRGDPLIGEVQLGLQRDDLLACQHEEKILELVIRRGPIEQAQGKLTLRLTFHPTPAAKNSSGNKDDSASSNARALALDERASELDERARQLDDRAAFLDKRSANT